MNQPNRKFAALKWWHGVVLACLLAGAAYYNYSAKQGAELACPGVALTLVGHDYGDDICASVQEAVTIARDSLFYDPSFIPQITIFTSQSAFAYKNENFNPDHQISGWADVDGVIESVFTVRHRQESIRILAHELVHAYQVNYLGDAMVDLTGEERKTRQDNLWVVEGYAEYITRAWDNSLCPSFGHPTSIDKLMAENTYFIFWGQVVAALSAGAEPEALHIRPGEEPDLDTVRQAARDYQQNQCSLKPA